MGFAVNGGETAASPSAFPGDRVPASRWFVFQKAGKSDPDSRQRAGIAWVSVCG